MIRYSDELIDEIKNNNDIVDVVSQYVALKRSGRNYFGLCPFHNEKSPSFAVSPDKQIFHCFGCGVGGNVIHFISKIEGLNFRESIELLAEKANITLPKLDSVGDNKTQELKDKIYQINKETAYFYHENLYKPSAKFVLSSLISIAGAVLLDKVTNTGTLTCDAFSNNNYQNIH